MKIIAQTSLLCAALFGATQIYANAEITITGEVVDTTCTLAGAEGTDQGYDDIAVVLDTISSALLPSINSVAGQKSFKLKLTKGDANTPCDTVAKDKFSGITLSSRKVENDNTLVNTAPETPVTPAEGRVDLQVLTDTNQLVNFNEGAGQQASSAVTQVGGFPTVEYKAQYIRTGAEAVSQPVKAVMTYVLNYN